MSDSSECGRPCVDHLLDELNRLVDRYEMEYDITVVEFVGCLEAVKHELLERVSHDSEE